MRHINFCLTLIFYALDAIEMQKLYLHLVYRIFVTNHAFKSLKTCSTPIAMFLYSLTTSERIRWIENVIKFANRLIYNETVCLWSSECSLYICLQFLAGSDSSCESWYGNFKLRCLIIVTCAYRSHNKEI